MSVHDLPDASVLLRAVDRGDPICLLGKKYVPEPKVETWTQQWEHVSVNSGASERCVLNLLKCSFEMAPGQSFIITARNGGFVGRFEDGD